MKNIVCLGLIALLASCATVQQRTEHESSFNAVVFNNVYSDYMEKPTSFSTLLMSDGTETLVIRSKQYGSERDVDGMNRVPSVEFSRENIEKYINEIEIFEKWSKDAKKSGDLLTKEIGRVPSGNGQTKFVFYAASTKKHFLHMSFCAVGTCLDNNAITLRAEDVPTLKQSLVDFSKGAYASSDVSSKYSR